MSPGKAENLPAALRAPTRSCGDARPRRIPIPAAPARFAADPEGTCEVHTQRRPHPAPALRGHLSRLCS
jgi:hypothetical protein